MVALAALGFGGTACSRGEKPQPSGAPMGAPHARSADENRPPVIQRLSVDPSSPVPGDHVRAMATAVDPDGDPVTVRYVWTVDGQTLAETGPEIAPDALAPGSRIEVEAVASDGRLESQPEQASVEVRGTPPEVTSVGLAPAPFVPPGDPVVAHVDLGGSADGVELHYQWFVNDDPAGQDADRLDTKGLHRGDRIAVSVTAARGDEEGDAVRSADIGVANAPPKILSQPQGALGADGTFRYEVKAEDPDGDTTLRYRLDHAPEGMTIDPVLGVVTWRPNDSQLGRHEAEVVVSDGHGGETHQKIELRLTDSSGSGGDSSSGTTAGTPAPASPAQKGGSGAGGSGGDEEAAAPAPAPVRYRRYGHPPGPATPAAPAPDGGDEESGGEE
jgi:hypothetical protein